jgi:hypothetical protein
MSNTLDEFPVFHFVYFDDLLHRVAGRITVTHLYMEHHAREFALEHFIEKFGADTIMHEFCDVHLVPTATADPDMYMVPLC